MANNMPAFEGLYSQQSLENIVTVLRSRVIGARMNDEIASIEFAVVDPKVTMLLNAPHAYPEVYQANLLGVEQAQSTNPFMVIDSVSAYVIGNETHRLDSAVLPLDRMARVAIQSTAFF